MSDDVPDKKGLLMDELLNTAALLIPPPLPTNYYGVFTGTIDQNSLHKFQNTFAQVSQQQNAPNKHLHLLFQSTGGTIGDGIAMYYFIKNAPMGITIYNQGQLSSMATLAFLGASERIVSQHGTFMLHANRSGPVSLPSHHLKESLRGLEIDDDRVSAIYRSHLELPEDEWKRAGVGEFWLTADDAIKARLTTQIGDFVPPKGMQLIAFNF
jgi:ATP-dependent protease ClpP protease subunit